MSGSLGFAESALSRLNGRLIGIDRPGLGRSDADPDSTLSSWALDIKTLIDSQNLRNAVAVGFSQGAPYALQLGAVGAVRGVAVVSGQDDFNFGTTFAKLDDQFVVMFNAFRLNPETIIKTVNDSADADWLWTMIMTMSSEADRGIFGTEPLANAYRQSLVEGFCQGAAGYVRDLQNTWSAWPFRVEDLSVPVDLWYGGEDKSPVHSPDFGQTLAVRIPNSRLFYEEKQGSALLWTMGKQILTELLKH